MHFYLDENVPVAVATQLRRRNIEVVTARDLDALGDSRVHVVLEPGDLINQVEYL